MNSDTLVGNGREAGGIVKEKVGAVAGDTSLQGDGVVDQIAGKAQQGYGAARDAIAPAADKARQFAKARPYATAALVGVVGLALLNTLRGK